MKVGVENYWRFNGMKTPSMKARTKVLASFKAGMNLPNLPWHVSITEADPGKSLAFAKLNNSPVKCKHFFGSFALLHQNLQGKLCRKVQEIQWS